MIQVQRIAEPSVLTNNAQLWTQDLITACTAEATTRNPTTIKRRQKAEKKYQHQQIKSTLNTMFSGKCAYCESYIRHIEYGHIEHYRPKSTFPALCFDWNNLLLSCSVCNGKSYKGDQFPTPEENGPLVNPTEENPEDFFTFEYDHRTGTANVIPINPRGETTVQILGLNRLDLVRHRSELLKNLAFIAIKASQGDEEALRLLQENAQRDKIFSAFVISIARTLNLNIT